LSRLPGEIPDLIELQKKNADRLVILGISLDGQTDPDEPVILWGRTLKMALATTKAKRMTKSISPRFAQR